MRREAIYAISSATFKTIRTTSLTTSGGSHLRAISRCDSAHEGLR
jgi:hypothetical protein